MDAVQKKNIAKIDSSYMPKQHSAQMATARNKKLLYRRLTLFSLICACISYLMISSILSQSSVLQVKTAQKVQLDKQLANLKQEQQSLKADIVKLNDNDYIAKLAREEYFLSEKNEIIFNIPNNGKGN